MGDRAPQSKPEEQYPLLKIDGGGDINHPQPAQTFVTPAWGVTCTNKQSRFSRWPEYISACWMTLILCGISCLVFYALGMGVYRRHQFIIMKCNTSKPGNNVFYHNIVPRGIHIPFVLYSEYLANMATQYPLLYFNVYFLVDDSYAFPLHIRRSLPYYAYGAYKLDEITKDALDEFKRKYQNVNVTIIPLSKYMAMTPLRFKWRLIPQAHLTFYARVFSVWQNGGIGMDLRAFNNDFHNQHLADPRIDAIMRQHNDGINAVDYANALNKIDKDEESAFCNVFYGLINHFLNETRSFLNRTLTMPRISNEKSLQEPLIRTHRGKRKTSNQSESALLNETTDGPTNTSAGSNVIYTINLNDAKENDDIEVLQNATTNQEKTSVNTTGIQTSKVNGNGSDTHQVMLFYDFTIFSDSIGPSYFLSESLSQPSFGAMMRKPEALKLSKPPRTLSHLLSIDAEGEFIAASSRLHPFLGHLVSAGWQRMLPKFAIQDALMTQCSGMYREDVYCNNIYIL